MSAIFEIIVGRIIPSTTIIFCVKEDDVTDRSETDEKKSELTQFLFPVMWRVFRNRRKLERKLP